MNFSWYFFYRLTGPTRSIYSQNHISIPAVLFCLLNSKFTLLGLSCLNLEGEVPIAVGGIFTGLHKVLPNLVQDRATLYELDFTNAHCASLFGVKVTKAGGLNKLTVSWRSLKTDGSLAGKFTE